MPEQLFKVVNLAVMPFWFLMIFMPAWKGTQKIIGLVWILLPLPLLYLVLIFPHLGEVLKAFSEPPKLDQITQMLGKPESALVAWIHFLAFDLFVGRWIYLDSRSRQISLIATGVCLAFTFLLGPIGLAGYLILRQTSQPISTSPVDH